MPRHGNAVNSHAPPYYRQDPSVKTAIDEILNSFTTEADIIQKPVH